MVAPTGWDGAAARDGEGGDGGRGGEQLRRKRGRVATADAESKYAGQRESERSVESEAASRKRRAGREVRSDDGRPHLVRS